MTDAHREQVAAIARLAGPGSKRILELGVGGGQSAAAAVDLGRAVVAVEPVPSAAANARSLAAARPAGQLLVIEGDLYAAEPGDRSMSSATGTALASGPTPTSGASWVAWPPGWTAAAAPRSA